MSAANTSLFFCWFLFCLLLNYDTITTTLVKIRMPEVGGGGKILEWHKKKGDIVRQEDVLCEIDTKV